MVGTLESGEEACTGKRVLVLSVALSIINVLCDPGGLSAPLWASVLPSVEWETKTRERKPLVLGYSVRK